MDYLELIFFATILIPYWILCAYWSRKADAEKKEADIKAEKLKHEAASAYEKYIREICFDAIAFAKEADAKAMKFGQKMEPGDKLSLAAEYLMKEVEIDFYRATEKIESVLGKVSGEGATRGQKVCA